MQQPQAFGEAQEQRIAESIVIDAPPEPRVGVAGDFAHLDRWYPFIDASRLVLGRNGEARRDPRDQAA
jgi:hypothetical protein